MTSVPVETQIDQCKAKIAEHIAKLDSLASIFVGAAKTHLPLLFQEWTDREVRSNPDRVRQLGKEKIGAAKQEFNVFNTQLPELIANALPRPADWWHHQPPPEDGFAPGHPVLGATRGLTYELITVASPFGAILIKYGLAKIDREGTWEGTPNEPQYRHGIQWPTPVGEANKNYVTEFRSLVGTNTTLKFLEKMKSEKDAKDLWDSA